MYAPTTPASTNGPTTATRDHRAIPTIVRRPVWLAALTLGLALRSWGVSAQAQQTSPTAPDAVDAGNGTASAPGTLTVSAGAPDADTVAAYRLARTPLSATVSVPTAPVVAAPAATTPAPAAPAATPPTTTVPPPGAPAAAPAVVSQLSPDPLSDLFDPVGVPLAAGAKAAPAVSVSVDFGFPSAGRAVFVQPFSGGTVDGQGGGHFVILDATGACTFSFQPLARTGRYLVSLRFDNVETGLRFLVYDPAAKGSDRKPAALSSGTGR